MSQVDEVVMLSVSKTELNHLIDCTGRILVKMPTIINRWKAQGYCDEYVQSVIDQKSELERLFEKLNSKRNITL